MAEAFGQGRHAVSSVRFDYFQKRSFGKKNVVSLPNVLMRKIVTTFIAHTYIRRQWKSGKRRGVAFVSSN